MNIFDIHIGVSDAVVESGKNILQEHALDDGMFPNQVDIPRLNKGNVELFCGMMCPIVVNKTNDSLELPENAYDELQQHLQVFQTMEKHDALHIVDTKDNMTKQGIKVILGIEGIYNTKTKDDIDALLYFVEQGVKIIGPMWNIPGNILQSARLTELDTYFLDFCHKHNLILDLAHSEEKTFFTIFDHYQGSVIDSHTNLAHILPHRRNISHEQIKAIIAKKGIVGITASGKFIGGNTLDMLYRHIDMFLSTYGEDYLAIGTDFDGMGYPDLITEFEDVSTYGNLIEYLEKRNLSSKTIQKIMFQNAFDYFYERIG